MVNDIFVVSIIQKTIWVAFEITIPLLFGSMVIGLAIGIFQAVTQIHEMTLTFVPKIIVVGVILILLFPWIINTVIDFTMELYEMIHLF